MDSNVPENLRVAFSEKKLIPIVAAGVSMSLKKKDGNKLFPSWPELLNKASDEIAAQGNQDLASAVKMLIKLNKYKEAADFSKEGLVGGLWSKFFKKIFDIKRDDIDLETLDLPKAIWSLSERIITLNYENVLRHACPENYDIKELDNTAISSLVDFSRDELGKPTVWHLHGKIDNLENIIFTSDSYCQLYFEKNSAYQAALKIFNDVCGKNTILFVGCSLEDADLIAQLAKVHDVFSGNAGPHYALVREEDSKLIAEKLKNISVIKIITFCEFGAPLLEKISEIKGGANSMSVNSSVCELPDVKNISLADKFLKCAKIAVFCANPIGEFNDYSELLKAIKAFKCDVVQFPLNAKSLNEVDGFNYVFILSSLIKGKIIIEDSALQSSRIGLKDLIDNIGNSVNDGIFVFINNQTELEYDDFSADLATLSLPILVSPKIGKDTIASLGFKLFRKHELDYLKNTLVVNREKFILREFIGLSSFSRPCTKLPDSIDPKSIRHYIGRKTDLQNICREIINLSDFNEFLTIKGSGGIGKTITIKKIAVALAEHKLFSEGIDFVDCEFIVDYSSFVKKIAVGFNLENAIDIKEAIKNNLVKQEKLVILDNVETLLHLDDTQKIKDFIYFICDYASVVITSRELLNLDCEQVYELRSFSTDEAYDLFIQQLGCVVDNVNEINFIRVEIIEKLLDNNPLAISIVANNIPRGKNLNNLKDELENDIFRKVSSAELFELDSVSDLNIERKKSLYASINFSYQHLNSAEKMAFEVLSLFPDGINMEHLKRIVLSDRGKLRNPEKPLHGRVSKRNNLIVTDSIIKDLENKSMVQIDNHIIKLQSILGRFAEHKLKERNEDELSQLYHDAICYNFEFVAFLAKKIISGRRSYSAVFNENKTNFFKSIEYVKATKKDGADFVQYLEELQYLAVSTTTCSALSQVLEKNMHLFQFDEDVLLACNIVLLYSKYFEGEFDASSSKMRKILPLETVPGLKISNKIQIAIKRLVATFYAMEGEKLLGLNVDVELKSVYGNSYPITLFQLGDVNQDLLRSCKCINFFTLEAMNVAGQLNNGILDSYIEEIYEKDHLELMQVNYLKAKFNMSEGVLIDKGYIEKLVVVNPFALGLQQIMLAFVAKDIDEKTELFEKALSNLKHIHYYYVEALLYYARTLQIFQHSSFYEVYQRGLDLACHHHYRWLRYQFEELVKCEHIPYSSSNYPFPEVIGLDGYIKHLIKINHKADYD